VPQVPEGRLRQSPENKSEFRTLPLARGRVAPFSEGSGLPACRHGAAPRNVRRGNEALHFLEWRKISRAHPNLSRIFIIAFD